MKRFVGDASNYKSFLEYDYYKQEQPKYTFPLTLEGQVVFIADEIAQREHDLDDSLLDEGLNLSIGELSKEIFKIIKKIEYGNTYNTSGYSLFKKLKNELIKIGNIDSELKWNKLKSIVISYFIRDVTQTSLSKIYSENENDIIRYDDLNSKIENPNYTKKFIIKNLIDFSECGELLNEEIKMFIEKNIIDSFNVNRFDGKGKYILRQLFKAYYENPKQMTKKQINTLKKNITEFINILIMKTEGYEINEFDVLSDETLELLKLKTPEFTSSLQQFKNESNIKDENEIFNYINACNFEEMISNESNDTLMLKIHLELHYCYLSTICDYISQMTDDYAIKEYQELYLS